MEFGPSFNTVFKSILFYLKFVPVMSKLDFIFLPTVCYHMVPISIFKYEVSIHKEWQINVGEWIVKLILLNSP